MAEIIYNKNTKQFSFKSKAKKLGKAALIAAGLGAGAYAGRELVQGFREQGHMNDFARDTMRSGNSAKEAFKSGLKLNLSDAKKHAQESEAYGKSAEDHLSKSLQIGQDQYQQKDLRNLGRNIADKLNGSHIELVKTRNYSEARRVSNETRRSRNRSEDTDKIEARTRAVEAKLAADKEKDSKRKKELLKKAAKWAAIAAGAGLVGGYIYKNESDKKKFNEGLNFQGSQIFDTKLALEKQKNAISDNRKNIDSLRNNIPQINSDSNKSLNINKGKLQASIGGNSNYQHYNGFKDTKYDPEGSFMDKVRYHLFKNPNYKW